MNPLMNRHGTTPLMWAASNGYLGIVQALLERGVDVNARSPDGRYTTRRARTARANL
jgi:ankyrin repeat protein